MPTVFISGLFFLLSVAIHLILCRIDADKSLKTRLFMLIALENLIAFLIAAFYVHLPFVLTCAAIYVVFVPVYLVFYVTTELVSPSKKVLHIVASSPGSTYAQIFKALEKENFIIKRLEELEQSGCVAKAVDRYGLTSLGRAIAKFLVFYQALLGRDIGG